MFEALNEWNSRKLPSGAPYDQYGFHCRGTLHVVGPHKTAASTYHSMYFMVQRLITWSWISCVFGKRTAEVPCSLDKLAYTNMCVGCAWYRSCMMCCLALLTVAQIYFAVWISSSRYSPYVIAMAHRVIAQWFVVCRVHYRPAVARYINKTLTTDLNVTTRKPIGMQMSNSRACIGLELMEVCQDMLARYTYSNLSTLPSR